MSDLRMPETTLIFPEQDAQVARVLGRAFIDDPPFRVILPNVSEPVERATRLAELFAVMLRMHRGRGLPVLGMMSEGKVAGAAITEGVQRAGIADTISLGWRGMPRLVSAIGWGGVSRALRLQDGVSRLHPREPHLYLSVLGVDPDYQRRHYGVAMLRELRAMAALRTDLNGVYLETATEGNVAFYRSQGYEVVGEMELLGVKMWRMLQPRR